MRNIVRLTEALFAKDGDAFTKVSLPHTWNNLDGQDGMTEGSYWRGLGCYHLELPNPTPGKKQYVEFRGANHVATVYCNGREMGRHRGGFSTFRFDLTPAMQPEGNILTVEVTNAECDVYPQQADFTFFGGLYRPVSFIEVDPAHFDLLKTGTDAVFVTPHSAGLTRVDLFPVDAEGCEVQVVLKDAEGNVAAQQTLPAAKHTVVKLRVANPHLWNGMADPYCYTCEATLLRDGQPVDSVCETYGYRSFHVDPDNGFFLNGKSYPLHGVSRHQDRLDMGWAITEKEHEEDIELIREVGANSIRLAHYQHDQHFYDLCDRTGFVLWAEIPFISKFRPGKDAYDNTISQMTELVAQNYNHPAICFWGISNEITIGGESEALYRNLADLNALVKKLDPSRLTTMAEVSMVPMDSEHVYITDVLSYNHYFGWYVGDVEDNGPWLDKFHATNPDRCLGMSEYGAEAILTWHTSKPQDHDYTEEYQALYHHEMLKTFATRPYLWSTYVWNMFDFAADQRDEGGCKGRNNKGLVTFDRKTRKDSFYIYQAYWTDKPMVHVCGRRFTDRAPGERDITVYTNCDEVTLVVNGAEVATRPAVDHAVTFPDVALLDGANNITARAGGLEDSIVLNGVAEHNRSYDLPAGEGDAGNWFDENPLEFPEGFYSIRDKVRDLLANPDCARVLQPVVDGIGNAKSLMGGGFDSPMGDFMRSMRLENLLKMAGSAFPAELKRTLNEELTKIRK